MIKDKTKVTFISPYPSTLHDSRISKQAASLNKQGYDVVVLCASEAKVVRQEERSDFKVYQLPSRTASCFLAPIIEFLSTKAVASPAVWALKFFARAFNAIEYFFHCLKFYRKTQVVHCHRAQTLYIGVLLRIISLGTKKLIYDAREYESDVSYHSSFENRLNSLVEAIAFKFTNKVITVSPAIAQAYVKKYSIIKPTVIMNCPKQVMLQKKSDNFRHLFNLTKDQRVYLYQGRLSYGRGIDYVLKTFESLTSKDVVVFMGDGPLTEKVQLAAKVYANIFYHPPVLPEELIQVASSADIGLCLIEPVSQSYEMCLPNKYFEYSMSLLPIIVSNRIELSRFVSDHKNGLIVNLENEDDLMNRVLQISDSDIAMMSSASQCLAKEYHWEAEAEKLLDVYSIY